MTAWVLCEISGFTTSGTYHTLEQDGNAEDDSECCQDQAPDTSPQHEQEPDKNEITEPGFAEAGRHQTNKTGKRMHLLQLSLTCKS